jgi:hypothetical protein
MFALIFTEKLSAFFTDFVQNKQLWIFNEFSILNDVYGHQVVEREIWKQLRIRKIKIISL